MIKWTLDRISIRLLQGGSRSTKDDTTWSNTETSYGFRRFGEADHDGFRFESADRLTIEAAEILCLEMKQELEIMVSRKSILTLITNTPFLS